MSRKAFSFMLWFNEIISLLLTGLNENLDQNVNPFLTLSSYMYLSIHLYTVLISSIYFYLLSVVNKSCRCAACTMYSLKHWVSSFISNGLLFCHSQIDGRSRAYYVAKDLVDSERE